MKIIIENSIVVLVPRYPRRIAYYPQVVIYLSLGATGLDKRL